MQLFAEAESSLGTYEADSFHCFRLSATNPAVVDILVPSNSCLRGGSLLCPRRLQCSETFTDRRANVRFLTRVSRTWLYLKRASIEGITRLSAHVRAQRYTANKCNFVFFPRRAEGPLRHQRSEPFVHFEANTHESSKKLRTFTRAEIIIHGRALALSSSRTDELRGRSSARHLKPGDVTTTWRAAPRPLVVQRRTASIISAAPDQQKLREAA